MILWRIQIWCLAYWWLEFLSLFQCFTRTAEQKRRKFPPSQKEIQCLTERSVPYTSLHHTGLLFCPIFHLSNLNIDDNVLIWWCFVLLCYYRRPIFEKVYFLNMENRSVEFDSASTCGEVSGWKRNLNIFIIHVKNPGYYHYAWFDQSSEYYYCMQVALNS